MSKTIYVDDSEDRTRHKMYGAIDYLERKSEEKALKIGFFFALLVIFILSIGVGIGLIWS